LGDHPFIKLKVVVQNRWSLNEGSITGTDIAVTIVTYQLCKRQSADTVVIMGRYRLLADY